MTNGKILKNSRTTQLQIDYLLNLLFGFWQNHTPDFNNNSLPH